MTTRSAALTENNAIESALRTVSIERNGLAALETALSGELGDAFAKAVDVIGNITGRLIITGVGKSGISVPSLRPPSPPPARLPSSCMRRKPIMAIWA